MTDRKVRKTSLVELTDKELEALHGSATRRSSHLAIGVEERERDEKKGATNGSPVFNLPEDFAP